jgi:hypothetical protein
MWERMWEMSPLRLLSDVPEWEELGDENCGGEVEGNGDEVEGWMKKDAE